MTYRFLSPAQRDLAEAVEYYERASPGLGLEFLDEVERTVSRILLNPEAWTRVGERHRRCRARRFLYGFALYGGAGRGYHHRGDGPPPESGDMEETVLIANNTLHRMAARRTRLAVLASPAAIGELFGSM